MKKPYYQDKFTTIYHGDCRVILPKLSQIDLILTDPPYGLGYNSALTEIPGIIDRNVIVGDDKELDLAFVFRMKCMKIMFGAENYYRQIPHKGRWLCWDKRSGSVEDKHLTDKMLGSPFELAWIDKDSGYYKIHRVKHGGAVNDDLVQGLPCSSKKRFHPTQKPVRLFVMILNDYPKYEITVDPFMGVGTTLIAAKILKRKAIGIEIEEKFCEIAAKRLSLGEPKDNIIVKNSKIKTVHGFGF